MKVRYILPAVMLVVVACGGDDEATPAAEATEAAAAATEAPAEVTEAPTEATEAPAADDGTTAALPAECVSAPYDIEIRRSGDGENETFTVVDAEDAGRGVTDGAAIGYKIFATDFDIADDGDLIDQIFLDNLPADATLITLDLVRGYDSDNETPANEYPVIAAGDELIPFRDSLGPDASLGTQATIATSEGVTSTGTVNETASGTVLYADAQTVCVDVIIESESGYQLSGVITARVR